ncbi:hypothetical protein COCMIDRAFT_39129 [Bipolaris oryzae ATCC 44560]|uniref:Uncharacterized protein n=1 Tax=Bipolaris oryzae ATCC 44560 TaxID=930090 RepID=W6YTW4_COCMI|nr:uncharacterized protein COCMIDRAFT_39129 [Bipolaris oryzae ATCC 44560]EUC42897.1 hypothetical protein COCMIDRAFT_39129 [Bipolaris oryzae ATCC 44560]
MSQDGSDDWESASNDSGQGDDGNIAGSETNRSTDVLFSKRSQEEIENDVVQIRSRNSSISSGLARLSMSQITASQPSQPSSSELRICAFPEQFRYKPQHDNTCLPKTPLPEHHSPNSPNSPTQRRGSNITRNPISDTWREDAYMKKEAGGEKIVDVAKRQDRWRCEYCENLNERGVANEYSEADKRKDSHDAGSGVASSSKISPYTSSNPIKIPGSDPPGVAPGDLVKCTYCGEQMFVELSRYDPRELTEDGVRWSVVEDPREKKVLTKEVMRGTPQKRVRERWRKDAQRSKEELRRKSIGEIGGVRIEEGTGGGIAIGEEESGGVMIGEGEEESGGVGIEEEEAEGVGTREEETGGVRIEQG